MPSFKDDLIADLGTLAPAQVRAVAAYVKKLRLHNSQAETVEQSEDRSMPTGRSQATGDLFLTIDGAQLRVVECDPLALTILGYVPLGRSFAELLDPEYRETAEQAFAVVHTHKEIKNVRLRLIRSHGASFPINMAARWVDADESHPALIDILCRDISFLKKLGNIEIFSEMLSIGIALVDEHRHIAFANTCAERMFGYEQGELSHQPLSLLFPDVNDPQLHIKLDGHRDHHPQIEPDRELPGRRKDGSPIALKIGWSSIRLTEHRFAVASITDITVRKSIEGALRRHEEERALIFREGLVGDFTWDIVRNEVVAHPTVFRLYGAEPIAGPVPGSWFQSRRYPEDRSELRFKWLSQIAEGGQIALDFRVLGDDGVVRWIECRGIVVRDENGNPRQLHGLNFDITARKQAEERARSAEERLRTAVQFSSAALWRWESDEDVIHWFGPVQELTGRPPAALASFAEFKKILLPADVGLMEKAVARCLNTGVEYLHEFRIVRPDGEIKWLAGRGGLLRDDTGRVCGMTGVNIDITVRKNAEEELSQSERNFRELANVLPQIVFTTDAAGAINYRNERFSEVVGSSSTQGDSTRWADLMYEGDREATIQAWRASIASGQPYERECRIRDQRFTQFRWYLARAVPVRNAEGAIVRWIGTATDIHDQKTAAEVLEQEVQSRTRDLNLSLTLLRDREEQLEKSLHEKDAMLREIHHRVKNNLQIVSSLLSMQAANAPDSVALAPLRDSERRISSMAMIHEQLYGTDDMQTVEFAEHARLLSQTMLASMAESPLVTCCLELEPVSLTIHQAIPCALILNELLTNAFKYAYPGETGGEITVRLSCVSGLVSMVVSDRGVGLPSHVDPFAPKTLGMEIVQVLVNQIDGELIVGGGPGASFTVRFRPQENANESENALARSAVLSRN